jgi:hypothetical protein
MLCFHGESKELYLESGGRELQLWRNSDGWELNAGLESSAPRKPKRKVKIQPLIPMGNLRRRRCSDGEVASGVIFV